MSGPLASNPANALPVYVTPLGGGVQTSLNLTVATVLKAAPGAILQVVVVVAGSAPGKVNDCATTGAVAAGNQVASLPNAVGSYAISFPCLVGIVITPGTGQTLSASYT